VVVGGCSRVSTYGASCVVAYGVNLLLGAAILMDRRDGRLNQAAFIGCTALAAWSLAAYMLASPVEEFVASRWARFLAYAALLMAPVSLRIISQLTGRPDKRAVIAAETAAIALAALTAGGLVVVGAAPIPGGWTGSAWRAVPGPLGWLLGAYVLSVVGVSVFTLARHARETSGLERARARYFLVAAAALWISMVHDAAGAAVGDTLLPAAASPMMARPWVPPVSALWALITAYALVRDRLADLGAALRRSLVRMITLTLLTVPFVYLLVEAEEAFSGARYLRFSIVSLLAFAAAAFLVPPIRQIANERLDRLLGARSTRHRRALLDFSKESARFTDASELIARARFELTANFRLSAADVLLHDGRGSFDTADGWRMPGAAPDAAVTADLVAYFRQARAPVIAEEIRARVASPIAARAAAALSLAGASAAFELRTAESREGILLLGSRTDGEPFSIEDVETLTILSHQLASALQNARLAADLQQSREVIARTERLSAIGTLAAGLAHEIRNPLVSIRTFTQLLPERLDDPEFRSRFLDLTLAEVDRICALVNELLAFARPAPAALEPVDLTTSVERLCLLLASQAKSRGVALEMAPSPADVVVVADEDQIKQVVMNVVLNAVQACPDGGRVRVSCYTTETPDGRMGCVEVVDDGCGIAEEALPRIFDPFFTTRSEGTGLGLSVAHRIVNSHAGTIDVRSRPGRGSTFVVRLPADVDTARAVLGGKREQASDAPAMRMHG
jgi:two-component system NtrC family sensor kinase